MTPRQIETLPKVLFEIGKAIGSDEDLGALLSRISELVCGLLGADACSVMLLDVEGEELLTRAAHGIRAERLHRISFRIGEGVAGWVVANGTPALIPDVNLDERFLVIADARTPIASLACVPLVARGERVGAMTITSNRTGAFGDADVDLLGFVAKTIALDVENIRLHRLSITDPLTGTYNREFLHQRLPATVLSCAQRGLPVAVAMIDVDFFKSVNDLHGHDVGDRVLAEVAARMRTSIRNDDFIVRYGGEEFLIVLPGSSAAAAWEIGERMRARFAEGRFQFEDTDIEITISIGIADLAAPRPDEQAATDGPTSLANKTLAEKMANDLVRRADAALYLAKGKGRNRVEVST